MGRSRGTRQKRRAPQLYVSPVMTEPLFKLSRISGASVLDAELIADLQRVAQLLNSNTVPQKKYGKVGAYDYSTVSRRFGSWNEGLRLAGLALPTRSIYRTAVYSRTCLSFGSIEAGNHAAESCHHLRPPFRIPHTTAVLALGRHHLKRSLITPRARAPSHPLFNLTHKLPAARLAEIHRSAFAGTCFNVTASLVARAALVRCSRPGSSFMSTT